METLNSFVKRFCFSVGCYSHPNKTKNLYSLKKHNRLPPGYLGVFGWVRELKRKHHFEVASYKDLGDKSDISELADVVKPRYHWEKEGILFYVEHDSEGEDYQKAVKALKAILALMT